MKDIHAQLTNWWKRHIVNMASHFNFEKMLNDVTKLDAPLQRGPMMRWQRKAQEKGLLKVPLDMGRGNVQASNYCHDYSNYIFIHPYRAISYHSTLLKQELARLIITIIKTTYFSIQTDITCVLTWNSPICYVYIYIF